MTVAEVVAARLAGAGVRAAWGMPGGDTLPLVDALVEAGIPFHLVRDEASAGFAADATAQLTGAPGVCCATLGPGLLNLVGGVAGAWLDRSPVIALAGQVGSAARGVYTHMVIDQERLVGGVGKAAFTLDPRSAAATVERALAIATAPRQGPVWLSVPSEVAGSPAEPCMARPRAAPSAPVGVLSAPAGWRRPVLAVGFGGRRVDVTAWAHRLRAPVITTYKAKGAIDERDPWSLGAVGLSPIVDRVVQRTLDEADGIVLIGWDPVELRDHWLPGWRADLPVCVVDDHIPTDIPCRIDELWVGPVAVPEGGSTWRAEDVVSRRAALDAIFEEGGFGPATVVRAVQAATPPDAVVTLDVGAHRITASQVWRCRAPDQLLQSNGLASMGYGLPAAIAACAAGHRALCLTGDAGLQMVAGELGTAIEIGGTLVVVVFVDGSLSLIGLKQARQGRVAKGVSFRNPDWAAFSEAWGGRGVTVDDPSSLEEEVRSAFARGGLTLVAVRFDPRPYVRQMG